MIHKPDVGEALRRLRGPRTQQSVAAAAGFHRQALGAYEQGNRLPAEPNLMRLLEALGVDRLAFEVVLLEVWEERLAAEAPESRVARRRAYYRQLDAVARQIEGLEQHLAVLRGLTERGDS